MRSLIILLFCLMPGLPACGQFGNQHSPTAGTNTTSNIEMLNSFYRFYISEAFDKLKPRDKLRDSLLQYCTKACLKRIDNDSEADADPFTHSQDIDDRWKNSLSVSVYDDRKNIYKVCLWPIDSTTIHCVLLRLKQEGGRAKIDSIFN